MSDLLPVHGFVLAGGKSSRMGVDKATLNFSGRPMVEIAVEKLRGFCADVSIAGNREDLARFAPVVPEDRVDAGPAAGIEAGLKASQQDWALFVPVDVPMVPAELLRRWAEKALERANDGLAISNLYVGRNQPVFCMIRRSGSKTFSRELDNGEHRLTRLFQLLEADGGSYWSHDLNDLYPENNPSIEVSDLWFSNVNTPEDLLDAEAKDANTRRFRPGDC